jgi:hypothetical protein
MKGAVICVSIIVLLGISSKEIIGNDLAIWLVVTVYSLCTNTILTTENIDSFNYRKNSTKK